MSMTEPPPAAFTTFFRPLEVLDDALLDFCRDYGFTLQKNIYRAPCRILRRRANPDWIIDLSVNQGWDIEQKIAPTLTYSLKVAALYNPAQDSLIALNAPQEAFRARTAVILQHKPLPVIQSNLTELLMEAVRTIKGWLPVSSLDTAELERQGWHTPLYLIHPEMVRPDALEITDRQK